MMQLAIQEPKIEQFFNHSKDEIIRALKFIVDNNIKDYKIITSYNDDENQILDDLKEFKIDLKNSGHKTDKFIQINDI